MSVRLCYENRRQLISRIGAREVNHTLVFFGGYISRRPRGHEGLSGSGYYVMAPVAPTNGLGPPGTPMALMPVELPTQSGLAYDEIKATLEEAARQHHGRTAARAYDPCMTGSGPDQCRTECAGVRNLAARWAFGPEVFDPLGALIVYGYSTGAFNAAWFCEEVSRAHAWYDFASRRTQRAGVQGSGSEVVIDLLVTVDPSIDNLPGGREASLASPRIARRHINYYRRERNTPPSRITQEGRAPDHYADNRPRNVASHGDMPQATIAGIQWEIRRVLNGLAPSDSRP
ncbi:MAG: hypothetical protein IT166_01980 [Bryobacterales bacterium]|nr:hypothetical protein [Bryobacterales bacterium]